MSGRGACARVTRGGPGGIVGSQSAPPAGSRRAWGGGRGAAAGPAPLVASVSEGELSRGAPFLAEFTRETLPWGGASTSAGTAGVRP